MADSSTDLISRVDAVAGLEARDGVVVRYSSQLQVPVGGRGGTNNLRAAEIMKCRHTARMYIIRR